MTRGALIVVCLCAVAAQAEEETAEQRVEALLSLPHGLNHMSPADRLRVAAIVREPLPHLAVLNRIFHPAWVPRPKPKQFWRDDAEMQLERALLLAGEMKIPDADAFIAGWYLRLAPDRLFPGSLDVARATALVVLGDRRDEQVVDYALSHLAWVDDVHRIQMLQYLAKSCRGDDRVVAELRAIHAAKLVRTDDLRRTIEWMVQPSPRPSPEGSGR